MSTVPPVPPAFPQPGVPVPDDSARPCKDFQYAVKIVCGRAPIADAAHPSFISPGQYFTCVNIHNPHTCTTVTFRWRVVVAGRIGAAIGLISAQQKITLRPEQSIEIDCPDILRVTHSDFAKGFIVLESPCELDVVAVYTASPPQPAGGSLGSVVAFHTERVPARLVEACRDDLVLDLSTGVANWEITSAPAPITTPRPAAVIVAANKHGAWAVAQPTTEWIGVYPFANIPNVPSLSPPPGDYTFQTCFELCSGFENASIDLHMRNDDAVPVVWLNGTPLPGHVSNLANAPTNFSVTQGFLPGVNCLSIVVHNDVNTVNPNPVGLNLKATLKALRGACPDCGCACKDSKLVRPKQASPTDPTNPTDPPNPADPT